MHRSQNTATCAAAERVSRSGEGDDEPGRREMLRPELPGVCQLTATLRVHPTRTSDGGLFASLDDGRIGRGHQVTAAIRHTLRSLPCAQSRQNVHSNEQIIASAAFGGRSLLQHSQLGRNSSNRAPPIKKVDAGLEGAEERKSRPFGPWEVEADPLGRGQCTGEPVLRRWSSPRFIRHSGLADTAHRTDFSSRAPVQ